jgi:hypothetical protein
MPTDVSDDNGTMCNNGDPSLPMDIHIRHCDASIFGKGEDCDNSEILDLILILAFTIAAIAPLAPVGDFEYDICRH